MNPPPWRYAISDRNGVGVDGVTAVVRQATRLADEGVHFFQIREKDLPAGDVATLARRLLAATSHSSMKVLVNGRADVAIAAKAHGIHLPSHPEELTAPQVHYLYTQVGLPPPIVTASCHTLADVERRRAEQVDAILFGPVFEKVVAGERLKGGSGLSALREACIEAGSIPVLAIGGITITNTAQCLEAGARGVAGIRLFQ